MWRSHSAFDMVDDQDGGGGEGTEKINNKLSLSLLFFLLSLSLLFFLLSLLFFLLSLSPKLSLSNQNLTRVVPRQLQNS